MAGRARKGDSAGARRSTLTDVAKLAGVSLMTASRAINGERYVSAEAMDKVREAARHLEFVPHQGARNLATNRAGSIALIAPMAGERFFNDPNIAPIMAGASSTLTALDTQLVILVAGDARQMESVRQHVLAQHVDGAIIVSPQIVPDVVDSLLEARVPLAATGFLETRPGLDVVDVDTAAGVTLSVRRLLERGCTSIGLISGPDDDPRSSIQQAAYDSALPDGMPRSTARGDYSIGSGVEALERILGSGPVDGLVVGGDAMAVGAIQALQQRGIRVPDEVMVVGYDDSSLAETTSPRLTTIRVPFYDIGAEMAELVWRRVNDPARPGSRTTLETTLVERASG